VAVGLLAIALLLPWNLDFGVGIPVGNGLLIAVVVAVTLLAILAALAPHVGPFRLTKALLGALTASAREGCGAVVLNVSSDAAINPYARWGAYGASKAALRHMSAIWGDELAAEGVRFLSLDPGDMDTPLHAAALPDADPATLKRPETAARELADAVEAVLLKEHA
jgi:NAD(P)-dependent dehydrogenase (short-subunit alcohol dehydrogenase family)